MPFELHVELLEIGRETGEALVVGNDGLGGETPDIAVPNPDQGHQDRDIVRHRRVAEMLVHIMPAAQEILELVGPDRDRQTQADRRPHRIAPADPVPEAEDAIRADAEGGDPLKMGGHGGEMVRDGGLAQGRRDPGPRGRRIGHGLLGGEGLGRDDEQGARRVERGQRVGNVRAVDVGDEMGAQLGRSEGRKGAGRHGRAEVGAADADIDHIGVKVAARAANGALAHVGREGGDFRPFGLDRRHDVFAVDPHRLAREIAQGRVEGGAILGVVDFLPGEQGLSPLFQPCGAGEIEQMAERGASQAVLGIIIEQIVEAGGEMLESLRVLGEEIDGAPGRDFDPMGLKGGEGGGDGVAIHVGARFSDFRRAGP